MNIYAKWTRLHETRHLDNQIIMTDNRNKDILSKAKDEIIAYLTDGTSIKNIKGLLLNKRDNALYNYYVGMKKNHLDVYIDVRELYEQELQAAIEIAEKMKKANIPNYLDILAITPVRKWNMLEKLYLSNGDVKMSEFDKVLELITAFFQDIGLPLFVALTSGGIKFFVSEYLNEYYPYGEEDLKNNSKEFYERLKKYLSKEKVSEFMKVLIN